MKKRVFYCWQQPRLIDCKSDFYYKVVDVFIQIDRRDYNLLCSCLLKQIADIHKKVDVVQLVDVFASTPHRQME